MKKDYYMAKEIPEYYPIPFGTLNQLIKQGRFPRPDKREGKKTLYHRVTLDDFFSHYNKLKADHSRIHVNYEQKRQAHLKSASEMVRKHNIKSSFDYRNRAKELNLVRPETLFVYSITFEEIISVTKLHDPVCYDLMRLLDKKRSLDELSYALNLSKRSVQRKIKMIKEAGFPIISGHSGVWMDTANKGDDKCEND